jgi:hypothetical protein
MSGIMAHYDSKEARDKDIELLDKIFDVKSIEDKANEEYDFGEFQVINPKPTKEEKYVTWHDIEVSALTTRVEMPNGDIRIVYYNNSEKCIGVKSYYRNDCGAYIYDEDLFNALMLKKVE